VGVWNFVMVVVTSVIVNGGSGGSGSGSDSNTLAWLNMAIGVESVCSSSITFACSPPSRFDKGVVDC
jgi:hypothetical protein